MVTLFPEQSDSCGLSVRNWRRNVSCRLCFSAVVDLRGNLCPAGRRTVFSEKPSGGRCVPVRGTCVPLFHQRPGFEVRRLLARQAGSAKSLSVIRVFCVAYDAVPRLGVVFGPSRQDANSLRGRGTGSRRSTLAGGKIARENKETSWEVPQKKV